MSSVSRSVYQKKAEECKRLKEDIKNLVVYNDLDTHIKWKRYFEKEYHFNKMLREYAKDYLDKNPHLRVTNKNDNQ